MTQQFGQLLLCGWVWLAFGGCSQALLTGNATRALHAKGCSLAGCTEAAAERSTVSSSSSSSSPPTGHSIEPRIASLVERTIDRLSSAPPDRISKLRKATRPQQRAGDEAAKIGQSGRARQARHQQRVASDRRETLKMTNEAGDFCAAVSISSQLAVTALHCARTLCESEMAPLGKSLLGCKIKFEIPDGQAGEATVVSTSENDLLALLDLQRPQAKYGALCCDDPRAEDRVYTVSHPGGEDWLVSYGWLTRDPIALEWVEGQSTRVLVAEIPTKPGSSGGGLFDVQDRVVGVQIARWSRWTTDFGKAAFIQSSRIFNMAGRYCMNQASSACVGLRCMSRSSDVWNFSVR